MPRVLLSPLVRYGAFFNGYAARAAMIAACFLIFNEAKVGGCAAAAARRGGGARPPLSREDISRVRTYRA